MPSPGRYKELVPLSGFFGRSAQVSPLFGEVRAQLFAGYLAVGGFFQDWAILGRNAISPPLLNSLVIANSDSRRARNDAAKKVDCYV